MKKSSLLKISCLIVGRGARCYTEGTRCFIEGKMGLCTAFYLVVHGSNREIMEFDRPKSEKKKSYRQ